MSNYYILGTKYTDPNNDGALGSKDIFPKCLQRNVIAIGFAWDLDLTEYYSRNIDGLESLLQYHGENPTSIGQMQRFMQLKPGDIIALKGTGSPIGSTARLDIVGYAVVTERDGIVYQHDNHKFPQGLGHTVNVEYLEYGIKRTFKLGYGRSIHHVEDPERISQIFGMYAETAERIRESDETARRKNLEEKTIVVSATYLKTSIHNRLQQCVYNKLILAFGLSNVKMEEDFVDLVLYANGKTVLIEVKPYTSARQCIIDGLGQLLNYYERSTYDKANLELMIIGSREASKDDIKFVEFISASLRVPFTYQGWAEMAASNKEAPNSRADE